MSRFTVRISSALGLAILLSAAVAVGQSRTSLKVNVPFSFTAAGKQMPSGTYLFSKENNLIAMSSVEGTTKARLPVITLLARSSAADDHLLAFDKVGDARILSEVWIPGQDGYLVHSERGEHKHEIVRLVPKARQ